MHAYADFQKKDLVMIDHLDHLVLTCTDAEATTAFYTRVMQMQLETFGAGRIAFRFGNQKINLHVRGSEFEPKAHLPVPGALDLCFIASVPLDQVIAHLRRMQLADYRRACRTNGRDAEASLGLCAGP
jgi:catechol 2,3-dioxygenase-like lactoylglutathione lyase family enzyme